MRIDRRRKLPATILLRALGYENEEILDIFFDTNDFHIAKDGIQLDLVPERLRGEMAAFDIKAKSKVIVERDAVLPRVIYASWKKPVSRRWKCPRITCSARSWPRTSSTRKPAKCWPMPMTNLPKNCWRSCARPASRNSHAVRQRPGSRSLYLQYPAHRSDTTELEALVEIYRMMRPGEPPTKDAAQNLFKNLFFSAIATTCRPSAA